MRAVIDRVVEDVDGRNLAIVLLSEDEWEICIPLQYLPEGASEGDILDVDFRIDSVVTEGQRGRISSLIEKLQNKPRSK